MTPEELVANASYICTTSDVDETCREFSVRDAVMALWSQVELAKALTLTWKGHDASKPLGERNRKLNLDTMRMFLMYGSEHPARRKKRTTVDIPAMVEKWMPIIHGLATAHDKATVDQCEFDSEEHLLPLTSAPVKELRQFYAALCARLEADPTIPFFVWRSFKVWGDVVLKTAPDGAVKRLRGDLAKKVADLVEADIRPDLNAALVGALQWRDPESLEKMAAAVQGGAKPRMRGRESCLFLEVETTEGVQRVML